MRPIKWKTTQVRLGDLEAWEKNPAKISDKDAADLRAGIERFGFVLPFVASAPPNGSKKIPLADGHQRRTVSLQLLELSPETLIDIRIPSRKLSEQERKELSIRLRKNTGEWDLEKLEEFFEKEELEEWGFEESEFEEMDLDFNLDPEEELEAKPDPAGLIGIRRRRWSSRHRGGFFALRSFTTERKKKEVEWLKEVKRDRPDRIIRAIAQELSQALRDTFGDLSGFIATGAPSHVTGFSLLLARLVAADLGIEFLEIFTTQQEDNAPRRIFGSERPQIRAKKTKKGIVWIDDTLTTGQTLRACREQVGKIPFIPIVWIYDDAKERREDG